MIKCLCIDDSKRPAEVPESKWVKNGNEYHVVYAVTCLPQKVLGFYLYELDIENCKPYACFLSTRFAFTKEGIDALIEMLKNLEELSGMDINKLVEECQLQTH